MPTISKFSYLLAYNPPTQNRKGCSRFRIQSTGCLCKRYHRIVGTSASNNCKRFYSQGAVLSLKVELLRLLSKINIVQRHFIHDRGLDIFIVIDYNTCSDNYFIIASVEKS